MNTIKKTLFFALVLTTVSLTADAVKFKLTNKSRNKCNVVMVIDQKSQPVQSLSPNGSIALIDIPQKFYIQPDVKNGIWKEVEFNMPAGKNAYITIFGAKGKKAQLRAQKSAKNNLRTENIKMKENVPLLRDTTQQGTQYSSENLTKEQWIAIGVKNGWISNTDKTLTIEKPEDLQKVLDREALEKLIARISKEAKINTKKLPIIKEAVTAFWEDAGRGQKTSIKMLPNYVFKALEQGDNTAIVAGMLGLWMGMPETARSAWRGEKSEKIGNFLEERVRLSRMLVIPTKPDTPKTIEKPKRKIDKRPFEQQAKEWDENKINREISKRRFVLSGPFKETDPKKLK